MAIRTHQVNLSFPQSPEVRFQELATEKAAIKEEGDAATGGTFHSSDLVPPMAPFSPGGPGIPSWPWFPLIPAGPGSPGAPLLPEYEGKFLTE